MSQTAPPDSNTPTQPVTACPLCGGNNECAIAAGKPPESCWCQSATITKEALAAISAEAVNKVCVCPTCGKVTGEPTDER